MSNKSVSDVISEKRAKYHTNKQTFKDFPVGTRVQVIVPAQDFEFFFGETGTVIRCSGAYLGIIVKFDKQFNRADWNFEPQDLRIVRKHDKKPSPFEEYFEEPVDYEYGRYVVNAKSESEAVAKFVAHFDDFHWIPKENKRYVIYQFKTHVKQAWVKWHGFIDDDGELHNGWCLYEDNHFGQPRFKRVWLAPWDRHYFEHGHHWEPTINERGEHFNLRDCSICGDRP